MRIFFCLLCLIANTCAAEFSGFNIKEFSHGGIKGWTIKDSSVPYVALGFSFAKAGSSYNPKGKEGLSAYFAYLMFRGRKDKSRHEITKTLDDLYVSYSVHWDYDQMTFFFNFPKENMEKSLQFIAYLFENTDFDDKDIKEIRNYLPGDAYVDYTDANVLAKRGILKKIFKGHPYAISSNGTVAGIQYIRPQDLSSFAGRYFKRDNLKVSIVGDMNEEDNKFVIDTLFKKIGVENGQSKLQLTKITPRTLKKPYFIVKDVPQSVVYFSHPSPDNNSKDWFKAVVLNHILGEGDRSRLWREVRDRKGLVYGINTGLNSYELASFLLGNFSTTTERVEQVMAIVKEKFKAMKNQGITPNELKEAKSYLTGYYAQDLVSLGGILSTIQDAKMMGLGMDFVEQQSKLINSLTLKEINEFAKSWLDENKLSYCIAGRKTER
jgi:zinc protease